MTIRSSANLEGVMKIDVRFTQGRQSLLIPKIAITADQAVRVPVHFRQHLYEVLVWRKDDECGLVVLLLPQKKKSVWRWSGNIQDRTAWTRLPTDTSSSVSSWTCAVRRAVSRVAGGSAQATWRY